MKRILSLVAGIALYASTVVAQGSLLQFNENITDMFSDNESIMCLQSNESMSFSLPYTAAAKHVEFKYHGIYCVTDVMMAYDVTEKVFLKGLNISGGWQWRRQSGFGIGVSYLSDAEGVFSQMPIYAELRSHYLRNQVTPYTSLTAGYTLPMGRQNGNKEMSPADIELTSQNRYVEFRYIFRNFGHVDYTALMTLNEVDESNNMKLEYKYNTNAYSTTGYGLVVEGTNTTETDKIKEKEVTMYYKGKPGDIMCNLTSTAMNLTYLGLSKNDFDYTICPECSTRCSSNDQLEDFLDCVRKTKKMDSRLGYSTWRKLAELFGVSMTTKYSDPQKFNALNNQSFINEINGYLSSGKSIQMSVWPGCKGHIVRLVAISTEGIVVDDPYGDVIRTKTCGKKTPRQTGFMHRQSCNSGGYNKNTNSQSSIVGKHNLWKWDEIKDVTCKGIFIFDK